jgi:cyclophilin family peptidyl-prolyl cis-trans isomerase
MDDDANLTPGVRAPSPEEVARQFIHSSGVLVPEDQFADGGRHHRRRMASWLLVLVLLVAGGGAYLVVRHHEHPGPSTSNRVPAGALTQKALDALAVKSGCPASTSTRANTLQFTAPSPVTQPGRFYTASVLTTAGTFHITFDYLMAPNSVNDFVFLAQHKYYNCNIFERAYPGQLDQTGDPTGSGIGTPGYTIADELPALSATPSDQYPLGSVAMINDGATSMDTSQWFVVTGPIGESLPDAYTLVGRVTSGMAALETINAGGRAGNRPPLVIQRVLRVTIKSTVAKP